MRENEHGNQERLTLNQKSQNISKTPIQNSINSTTVNCKHLSNEEQLDERV